MIIRSIEMQQDLKREHTCCPVSKGTVLTVLLCLPCKRAVGRAELLHNRSSCARETAAADEESLQNCVGCEAGPHKFTH